MKTAHRLIAEHGVPKLAVEPLAGRLAAGGGGGKEVKGPAGDPGPPGPPGRIVLVAWRNSGDAGHANIWSL